MEIIFRDSFGKKMDATLETSSIKGIMTERFNEYWSCGGGDATIFIYDDKGKAKQKLLIGINIDYGVYLQFNDGEEIKLSLYDKNKLVSVAETEEETYASVGLFLPCELAWKGIEYFISTGGMFPNITWVSPEIIPVEGNW